MSYVSFPYRVYAPIFQTGYYCSKFESLTRLAFLFKPIYNCNYTLVMVRLLSIEAIGVREWTELDQSFFLHKIFPVFKYYCSSY